MSAFKGKAHETFEGIQKTLSSIDVTLGNIDGDLKALMRGASSLTVERGSTLRLTELGRNVSQSVDARALAEQLVVDLLDDVFDLEPYDVQTFCFDYINEKFELSAEDRDRFKACAFDNGIDLHQVLDVLAIELRDILLDPQMEEAGP